ncbi:helix-turn-helix domain-containing protein [Ferroplasma sp.]|uniref:helix-turn-helix domain-containing protein n=1 Tax=Ferroplasma sp. TaxID=2591003 RepID=UPI002601DB34|nr:helix-turn-helix domain-containing protein [Ferroplasma sp.]MCL4453203.1 helix-turn-helix domain-containing protein [Candidatus Thermoplasmatota archaeon]
MFIRIVLNHKNCWSQVLSNSTNIYGFLLGQKTDDEEITGTVAFYSLGKHTNWEEFFNNMKEETAVKKIEHIESYGKSRVFIVKFVNNLTNSVTSLIEKYDVPFYREVFYRGLEIWDIFSWHENDGALTRNLEQIADVVYFKELENINFPDPFIDGELISNVHLLTYAIENGYYSNNKDINLGEMARRFGTSKSNLSRKFKRFETYTLNYYLANHLQYMDIDKYAAKKKL